MNWRDLFEYRDGNLYWKIKPSARVSIGDKAGVLDKHNGYIRVGYKNKDYRVHRIIFFMHYGYMPTEIDHINNIRTDNRIENLRAATSTQNKYNVSITIANTSGVKNVSWNKQKQKWWVRLRVNGKICHFGYFANLELAALRAAEVRGKYHGGFARGE